MDEISLKGMFTLALVKKETYHGSFKGMRYRLCKEEEHLQATVYPEPYCWEFTPDEQKISESFPFSEEGIDLAIAWLNQMFLEKYQK